MKNWLKGNWVIPASGITVCIGFIMILLILLSPAEPKAESSQYPISLMITNIDENTDLVLLVDCSGNLWSFRGKEDYAVGDIVAAIMDDKGTPEITDDEIINYCYCGSNDIFMR